MKRIPFAIDRSSTCALADQVTEKLRQAIVTGHYKPGDTLPTVRELAKSLGVSIRAPLVALKRLQDEGLVMPRSRTGSVVLQTGANVWRGNVLMIIPGLIPGYYFSIIEAVLGKRLLDAGYLPSSLSIPGSSHSGFELSQLRVMVRQKISLAVLLGGSREIEALLDESGVPFVVFGPRSRFPNCVGRVASDSGSALKDLVELCREKGVRSIVQASKTDEDLFSAKDLRKAGIRVENWVEKAQASDCPRAEPVMRKGMEMFLRRYGEEGAKLPDAFLLCDDYFSAGALTALLSLGVRVPENVKVVASANVGMGPCFPKQLTRIEKDPMAIADVIADGVLEYFATGRFPRRLSVRSVFRRGLTF